MVKKEGNVKTEDLLQDPFKHLIDAYKETLQNEYEREQEPFEGYCLRVRLSLVKDLENYRYRFRRGYLALLEVLDKERHGSDG